MVDPGEERFIEVRRHSARSGSAADLSPFGIELAAATGSDLDVDWAIASTKPRAQQTASALGRDPDQILPLLNPQDHRLLEAGLTVASFDRLERGRYERRAGLDTLAADIRAALLEAWTEHPRMLVVSHMGIAELTILALAGSALPSDSPAMLGHCEGMRLAGDELDQISFRPAIAPAP